MNIYKRRVVSWRGLTRGVIQTHARTAQRVPHVCDSSTSVTSIVELLFIILSSSQQIVTAMCS